MLTEETLLLIEEYTGRQGELLSEGEGEGVGGVE